MNMFMIMITSINLIIIIIIVILLKHWFRSFYLISIFCLFLVFIFSCFIFLCLLFFSFPRFYCCSPWVRTSFVATAETLGDQFISDNPSNQSVDPCIAIFGADREHESRGSTSEPSTSLIWWYDHLQTGRGGFTYPRSCPHMHGWHINEIAMILQ